MLSSLYYKLKALWGKDVMDAYLKIDNPIEEESTRGKNIKLLLLQITLVLVSMGVGGLLHWAIWG